MKKEITDKQHRELLDLGYAGGNRIADMIEFLGDDLESIEWRDINRDCVVTFKGMCFDVDEVVDSLWMACRYKLENICQDQKE